MASASPRHQIRNRKTINREIEIKLLATKGAFKRVKSNSLFTGTFDHQHLVARYFDTPEWQLRQSNMALRVRNTGMERVQTLKYSANLRNMPIVRHEWSTRVQSDLPELSVFPKRAAKRISKALGLHALNDFATLTTERDSQLVTFGHSQVEVAFDEVVITSARRHKSFCELELELKCGTPADLLRLALELQLGPDLRWSVTSKGERAYKLLSGDTDTQKMAHVSPLDTSMALPEAFRRIAWSCLNQLLRHYYSIFPAMDVEAVHQSRVAIRRLRTCLVLFKQILSHDEMAAFDAEFQAVTAALGPARDLDVFLAMLKSSQAEWSREFEANNEMTKMLEVERVRSYRSAQALLFSPACQKLLFRFALWIEDPGAMNCAGKRAAQPVLNFARKSLTKRHTKVCRSLHKIEHLTPSQRHHLRIEVKKLRYASDFFDSLLHDDSGKRTHQKYTRALGQLQNTLGELNDVTSITSDSVMELSSLDPSAQAHQRGMMQRLAGTARPSLDKLLKAARKAGAAFCNAHVFWHEG